MYETVQRMQVVVSVSFFAYTEKIIVICRWVNALDPKIEKGPWTKEQDKDLLENVNKFGKGLCT